jgi:hypothetical protein
MTKLIVKYNALSPFAKSAIKFGGTFLAGLITGLIL